MQENDFSSNGHSVDFLLFIFTLHAQREQGKVIGIGVHIMYVCYVIFVDKNIFESYFNDRFTFSNIRSRTSRQI